LARSRVLPEDGKKCKRAVLQVCPFRVTSRAKITSEPRKKATLEKRIVRVEEVPMTSLSFALNILAAHSAEHYL
jgi:hypothetical protein